MIHVVKFLRALILAPFLWCCAAHQLPSQPTPHQAPAEGVTVSATVALENANGIYCAGVWIGPAQVLTANHCVSDEESKTVTVEDRAGHVFPMGVIAADTRVDLALLSAPFAPEHATAALATSWAVGEHLTIVGHPARAQWVVMQGSIAHEMKRASPDNGGEMTMLWVQAPIWYGNSGGGAFDDQGHLVGICSMRSTQIPNQGWFVSPEEIHGFLAKL